MIFIFTFTIIASIYVFATIPLFNKWVNIKFEPRDLWCGTFWDIKDDGTWRYKDIKIGEIEYAPLGEEFKSLYIYICLIPCFPIIIKKRIK